MNNLKIIENIINTANKYPDATFSQKGKIYTCINPYTYHIVRNNKDIYDKMDGIFVDGITMCWWMKLIWNRTVPRLSFDMSSMANDLFSRIVKTYESIYVIGAKQEQLEAAIFQIESAFPGINVIGKRNGYFTSHKEREEELLNIVTLNPDYVIVGMGSPLQEKFVWDLKDAGYKGIAFTCGGFLHQTSKGIKYYPDWINKYNLRGAYRSIMEKGVMKRNYNTFIQFPILFLYDTFRTKVF